MACGVCCEPRNGDSWLDLQRVLLSSSPLVALPLPPALFCRTIDYCLPQNCGGKGRGVAHLRQSSALGHATNSNWCVGAVAIFDYTCARARQPRWLLEAQAPAPRRNVKLKLQAWL